MNIKDMILELLKSNGCTIEESSGILFVETPEGKTWDMSVPMLADLFPKAAEGVRVRAKVRVYDLPGNADPGPVRAEPGDLGTVVHTERGVWPTVTFDRTGTSTCVTPDEVTLV